MTQELKNKRLLVLGGTRISCQIIKKAQEMGLIVGAADYYPIERSPGKRIADEAYDVSVTDEAAVAELIKSRRFDGVITGFSDMLLPYYARICRMAGLPCYGTEEQFAVFTDKAKYKALLKEFGVPTVEGYDIGDPCFDPKAVRYPVLVKPADSSGSRGITVCREENELIGAIEKAKQFSRQGKVLVERYLTGREVTVFWIFADGKYYLAAIANRHVKQNQGSDVIPLPVGYTYPASITPAYRAAVEPNAKRMFAHCGIKNGIMFMQCKVEDGIPVVYDIGYRLTGTLEHINFRRAFSCDTLEMLINYAVTGKMTELDLDKLIDPEGMRPSFNVSRLASPGTIARIDGLDRVRKMPFVDAAIEAHLPGETITEATRGLLAQITVRVLGSVEKKEELYPAMHSVEEAISIVSTEGEELALPGIAPEDVEGLVL